MDRIRPHLVLLEPLVLHGVDENAVADIAPSGAVRLVEPMRPACVRIARSLTYGRANAELGLSDGSLRALDGAGRVERWALAAIVDTLWALDLADALVADRGMTPEAARRMAKRIAPVLADCPLDGLLPRVSIGIVVVTGAGRPLWQALNREHQWPVRAERICAHKRRRHQARGEYHR